MNGRILLDTNAIIALLNGDKNVAHELQNATWIGISVIAELEYLCFNGLTANDLLLFQTFKSRIKVIGLLSNHKKLLNRTIEMRQNYNLKLPDAIIAATTIEAQATLITNDVIFNRVPTLTVVNY
jgi:tRNA(fMet)-specific endonuclease VapC